MSIRPHMRLMEMRVNFVAQLVQLTERQLLMQKNLGRKTLREIKDTLDAMDLRLAMPLYEVLDILEVLPPQQPPPSTVTEPRPIKKVHLPDGTNVEIDTWLDWPQFAHTKARR